MRLFLAIPLTEGVRLALAAAVDRAHADEIPHWGDPIANWMRAENLHVTLKFLGEVAEADVEPLVARLSTIELPDQIELYTHGLELFPPRGPVRVIAAALDGHIDPLKQLHCEIERACGELGTPDGRPFRPHVTVGRVRRGVHIERKTVKTLLGLADIPHINFTVSEFVLMQSQLTLSGSIYMPIAHFPLPQKK